MADYCPYLTPEDILNRSKSETNWNFIAYCVFLRQCILTMGMKQVSYLHGGHFI